MGGCIIHSVNHEKLRSELKIENKYEIKLVIALGKPKEVVIIEELVRDGDFKYWRDSNENHHVPKRLLGEIIINNKA